MDDTFTIIKKDNKDSFLQHLNSIHPNIKFTCEEVRSDGSMPFLDILITPEEDGSLKTSVFRKPTHTDLYLQWDSHHTIPSKYSVAGTLYHRTKTVCSNSQLLQEEENHFFQALRRCKYPTWDINRVNLRNQNPNRNTRRRNKNNLAKTTPAVRTYICWFHIIKGLVRRSRNHARNLGYKFTSKEDRPSKAS